MKDSTITVTKEILNGLGDALKYIEDKATPLLKMYYEALVKQATIKGVFEIIAGVLLFLLSIYLLIKFYNDKENFTGFAVVSALLIALSFILFYVGIINVSLPEIDAIEKIIFMATGKSSI